MILKSQSQLKTSEDFRDVFLDSVTPGVIPRSEFIHWKKISEKRELYKKYFEFFRLLSSEEGNLEEKLRDALLADDTPYKLVKTAFELLGHTGKTFASLEDFVDFRALTDQDISEDNISHVSSILIQLGLGDVIKTDLEDYFLGIQVGLETHRRKNVGGKAFVSMVREELERIVKNLNLKGHDWALQEEQRIYYKDGDTSKKVDFLLEKGSKKIGVEVNFYTATGSKPTEIKRSYGQVNRDLEDVNASLIWITDGCGYFSMKRSLKEARDIHKNIYNLRMVVSSLENDLELI